MPAAELTAFARSWVQTPVSWCAGSGNSAQENQSAGLSLAQGSSLELQVWLFASISLAWQRHVSVQCFMDTLGLTQTARLSRGVSLGCGFWNMPCRVLPKTQMGCWAPQSFSKSSTIFCWCSPPTCGLCLLILPTLGEMAASVCQI